MLISLSRMPLLGLYKLSANLDDGCTSNNDAAVDSRGILRVGVGHYGYTDGLQTAYDPADQCKCFLAHNCKCIKLDMCWLLASVNFLLLGT